MLKLRIALLSNKLYYLIATISIIISLLSQTYFPLKSKYQGGETTFRGIVTNYNIDGNLLSMEIIAEEKIKASYYIKTIEEKQQLKEQIKLGTIINLDGSLTKPLNNTIPNTFNYNKYLQSKGIMWLLEVDKYEITGIKNQPMYVIKNFITSRIEKYGNTKHYLNTFILGDMKTLDNETYLFYQKNGVTHLFAVSGMHITIFTVILIQGLKKLKVSELKTYLIAIAFVAFYANLTNNPPSILRAGLFFALLALDKVFYTHIKTFNILLLTGSILIFINPYIVIDIGFQYSFATSLGLILASEKLTDKNYVMNLFKTSVVAFLFSVPISLNNFYEINLLSCLNNIIFVPLITIIVYPLSLIVFIIPFIEPLLHLTIVIMENFNTFLGSITIFTFVLAKLPFILSILFYLILIIAIKQNKNRLMVFLLAILIGNKLKFNFDPAGYVYFLDVGQGDSAIIIAPYNKEVIMIDTGGKLPFPKGAWAEKNRTSKLSDNTIIFLKSLGIKKIDTMILTHGDEDNMGEALNILKQMKVDKIILNRGDTNKNEAEIIAAYKDIVTSYEKKHLNLEIFNIPILNDENDDSTIAKLEIYNYKMLFMGDASKKTEALIIDKDIKADLIKLGHHGSKTSSDEEFLKKVSPNIGIISSGRNNRYKHPSLETIQALNKLRINYYNTQNKGTITLKITNNAHAFSYNPP